MADRKPLPKFGHSSAAWPDDNATWGAPKIHGELQKLGLVISERTVARYLQRVGRRGDSRKGWLTFLRNHREAIAAFDFFTIPTVTFQVLYCFFVIEHGRRKILHFNVTRHPTAEWIVQQVREAFPKLALTVTSSWIVMQGLMPTWSPSYKEQV